MPLACGAGGVRAPARLQPSAIQAARDLDRRSVNVFLCFSSGGGGGGLAWKFPHAPSPPLRCPSVLWHIEGCSIGPCKQRTVVNTFA